MIRTSFNDGWYVESETTARESAPVGPITVPHDAMMYERRDPFCANGHNTGYFPGGRYRYTKTFTAPEEWRDQVVLVEFEGVYQRSEVFLNGHSVGGRPSGYAQFRVALQGHLNIGTKNVLEVVVNNADEPNSRWYTGSGIYRPVHILVGPAVHIAPNGPRLSTAFVQDRAAIIDARTDVLNTGDATRTMALTVELRDRDGRIWSMSGDDFAVEPGANVTVHRMLHVGDAKLWSITSPELYEVTVTLSEHGVPVDRARDRFGIRTLAVDARQGLRINGDPVKLRGAAIHHDNGVIGAHTLAAAEYRRVRILKESGFNAIRSAHNPASRAMLDACDELGMLVMDELSDVWTRSKLNWDSSIEFPDWWERDLEALIEKDVNHPSVIIQSIGNEIGETATPDGVAWSRRLADRARELDPTRFVTNSVNAFLNLIAPDDEEKAQEKVRAARAVGRQETNKNVILLLNLMMGVMTKVMPRILMLRVVDRKTRDVFATVDIAGYNYMAPRFRGDALLHPERVMVGSENPPTQTVAIWHDIADQPHVIGDFTWTGWDYLGEGALATIRYNDRNRVFVPYPALAAGTPNIDITGYRQTQSYVNEIGWGLRNGPHLAVQPVNHSAERQTSSSWRATNSIRSWSWEGHEGRPAVVEVYANAARVELHLNGALIGTRRVGLDTGYLATFRLPYAPGELTAIAYTADGSEIGRDTLTSAGAGVTLSVAPEKSELWADGADLAYLPIELTDNAGILRPLADRKVTVTVDGEGVLLGFGSGRAITEEAFTKATHTTFFGRSLAVIRAHDRAGVVTVTVTADGCEPVVVSIPVIRFNGSESNSKTSAAGR